MEINAYAHFYIEIILFGIASQEPSAVARASPTVPAHDPVAAVTASFPGCGRMRLGDIPIADAAANPPMRSFFQFGIQKRALRGCAIL
jgi:hypothetical protein